MFEFELPCDWSVNRRPNNSGNEATPAPKGKHKQQQDSTTGESVMVVMKPINVTASENTATQQKNTDQQQQKEEVNIASPVIEHVLGPRSQLGLDETFFPEQTSDNASSLSSTHLPWSGQIKKLVVKHLQHANVVGSEDAAQRQQKVRAQETYLDTESLLSKLPYKKMLSDMFGGNLRGHLQTSVIPYVTRAYEEAFMHEPTNSTERECARGKQCECMFIDRLQPFTAVEFLLPGEQAPRTPHLCVLCCRATTQQLYYDVIFDKCEFPGTIQRFGNIHSEPGEYALDAMLIASSTAPVHIMPLPIVSHQRNRYSVYISAGIKRLKQSRVHFRSTPSCSAGDGQ
jgi:hypothetical protein